MNFDTVDIFQLEETIWVGTAPIGVPAYDFNFEPLFQCKRPYQVPTEAQLISRIGVVTDYEKQYDQFASLGFKLINSVKEHQRASELVAWYPLLKDYTPRSQWYEQIPDVESIERDFDYPIFIKGSRQTANHQEKLSVARNRAECEYILDVYQRHRILRWQPLVCREFIELTPVEGDTKEKISASFEFRSFWYKGHLVGVGPYWAEFAKYDWSPAQKIEALTRVEKVCRLVNVPFLVIDFALTTSGEWIVIECNDAQESGYAGISPIALWQKIVEVEWRKDK